VSSRPLVSADAYLAAIIDSSDDAIVGKDLNGIVTSWNPAAERLFGYAPAEMIGSSITKIIPADRLSEEDYVLGRIRQGLRVDHFETIRRSKSGRLIDISLTVSPIRGADGAVIGASKIARDITAQKRLLELQRLATAREEEAKRKALEAENQQIQEASRVKGEFVANMSHELRTPLNSILGFAEMIADERFGPASSKYPEFARMILRSAQHLLQMINDVLDLAKVDSGKLDLRPERTNIAELIGEAQSMMNGVGADRRIRIDVDVDPALGDAFLDPRRFQQILYNYLSNAIKFSHEDRRVLIRARIESETEFRVEVVDDGIGISPADHPRLFSEFQQLDSSMAKRYPGTGLGLAITKRIVEAQGGRVGVESELGTGSTFFAVLPRVALARAADITSRDDLGDRPDTAVAPSA
jgi:PAS domain S-box-containing protein